MYVEKLLKEYRFKKSYVDTTLARIEQYRFAIENPEMWQKSYIPEGRELGMPGRPRGSGVPPSPVEDFVTRTQLTEDILKEWIRNDESRIFKSKLEIDQLEKAMQCLTKQERFILECKYFDNMFWRDIEINYNNQFRQQNYLTYENLKKINREAISKLDIILEPFITQFLIA